MEAKKLLNTTAFLSIVISPSLLLTAWTFIFRLMYQQKPFLSSFVPLAESSYGWALAFLIPPIHSLAAYLHSSQVTCPCFLCLCIAKMHEVKGQSSPMPDKKTLWIIDSHLHHCNKLSDETEGNSFYFSLYWKQLFTISLASLVNITPKWNIYWHWMTISWQHRPMFSMEWPVCRNIHLHVMQKVKATEWPLFKSHLKYYTSNLGSMREHTDHGKKYALYTKTL